MTASVQAETAASATPPGWVRRLWQRELLTYPGRSQRLLSLSIVVLSTVLFYYQYYAISAVGDQVIASTGMSFKYFVYINVVSVLASSVTSMFGGITDRWGRANVVVLGVLGCALTCLIGFPLVNGALSVGVLYALLGAFEGIVLVATPALVRDFSPQVGRATAMGFWTIGPVAGSLLTAAIVTPTIDHVSHWQDEYVIAGWIGIGVFVLALLFLRELCAPLRGQIVVSEREAALAEARARGIDIEAATRSPMRQMLHLDILGSATAISVFLIFYYAAVGFLPIFFQTVFGYSTSKANSVGNWMWGAEALSLVLFGWLSDRLRVRKPFMVLGALGTIVATALVMSFTGRPQTSYTAWVVDLSVLTVFAGMAFAPWMAGFTETIERRNPTLTATGLSLWGTIVRFVAAVVTLVLPFMAGSATTLIQDGPAVQAIAAGQDPSLTPAQNAAVKAVVADPTIVTKVQTLAAKYKSELSTAAKLTPATQAALSANPDSPSAQVPALSEISTLSAATVTRVEQVDGKYHAELATAAVIDPATRAMLLGNPANSAAQRKAVGEIASGLRVSQTVAAQLLAALGRVPAADLLFMASNGPKVEAAAADLNALGRVPATDLAYLNRYGTPLGAKVVQQKLSYLQANAPKVQKAAADSPGEWNSYWLLGLLGEIVFLPLIFLMAGYWRPRRAREEALAHEAKVRAEMAEMATTRAASRP